MHRCLLALCLFTATAAGQGRLRPPENVGCDRNQLTAYQGKVRQYVHNRSQVAVEIQTDEETVERVVLPLKAGRTAESRFLWEGAVFQPRHWKDLEAEPGKLKAGMRVIAWVCADGGPPLLDWRPPAR